MRMGRGSRHRSIRHLEAVSKRSLQLSSTGNYSTQTNTSDGCVCSIFWHYTRLIGFGKNVCLRKPDVLGESVHLFEIE